MRCMQVDLVTDLSAMTILMEASQIQPLFILWNNPLVVEVFKRIYFIETKIPTYVEVQYEERI